MILIKLCMGWGKNWPGSYVTIKMYSRERHHFNSSGKASVHKWKCLCSECNNFLWSLYGMPSLFCFQFLSCIEGRLWPDIYQIKRCVLAWIWKSRFQQKKKIHFLFFMCVQIQLNLTNRCLDKIIRVVMAESRLNKNGGSLTSPGKEGVPQFRCHYRKRGLFF